MNVETSLKLVGSQSLIYCGDVFGELDMPGCAEFYRAAEQGLRKRKVLRGGNQRLGSRLLSNVEISPKFDIKCNCNANKR